jgi:hypothetical protein
VTDRLTYRFGPLERRGILGPVRAGQAVVIAAGAAGAIVAINQSPTAQGAFLALLLFAAAAGLAVIRVGGRTLEEWSPVVLTFFWRALRRRTRFSSAAPGAGWRLRTARAQDLALEPGRPEPPPQLRGLRLLSTPHKGAVIGVLADRRERHLTAILACRAGAFALLEPSAQERRLAGWGQVLASAAGTPLSRLQWLERTAPAQGDELARWVHSHRDPTVPLRGTAMIDSYLELIGTSAVVAHEHEILLALQIDSRRVRECGPDARLRALLEQIERVAQGLEAAQVMVLGALGPGHVARVLRTAFDPYARSELAALEAVDSDRSALPEASAWPVGAQEAWDHYRSDGALHATYWIGGWPRVDVSSMFLEALIARTASVRTVAVTFEPVSPERSTREAEAAITRDQAERELRRRFGQSQTARQRQAEEAAARREAELAAGHGEVRFAGFITVSARDEDELRRACVEVCDQAARARLELHRLYGQQATAFSFTLPLCRGLR